MLSPLVESSKLVYLILVSHSRSAMSNSTTVDGTQSNSMTPGKSKTSIHVTALDGIVSVNSLFTVAMFIGFSFTNPEAIAAGHHSSCIASTETVRRLIVLEVGSFSSFLLSSLLAQSLKLVINLLNGLDVNDPHKAHIDSRVFKYGLLLSAVGSFLGCALLTASMADFIQVKLGVFSCGGKSVWSLVTLVVGVGLGLLAYLFTSFYALCFM